MKRKSQITAEVIADSLNVETGDRLTTFRVLCPKFILAEINTHRMLCLAGDSTLEFDLPSGACDNKNHRRIYTMRIDEFVKKWHQGAATRKNNVRLSLDLSLIDPSKEYTTKELADITNAPENYSNLNKACRKGRLIAKKMFLSKTWIVLGSDFIAYRQDLERGVNNQPIRDRLQRMNIRIFDEKTGSIKTSTVKDCYVSGEKEVYLLKAGDYSVKASKDHRILTQAGWKRLEDINVGEDSVIVRRFGTIEKRDPIRLKKINGKWTSVWNRQLKEELAVSGINRCIKCDSIDNLEVHHKVNVHADPAKAFDKENVILLCQNCHNKEHQKQGWQVSQYLYGDMEKVDSVEFFGVEETYDLEIEGENPNFIANGIVVHNSRNFSSSRAVPSKKMRARVIQDPVIPVEFGKNKKGMQSGGSLSGWRLMLARWCWLTARFPACFFHWLGEKVGLHKQICNRIIEPWVWAEGVISGTTFENLYKLRCHPDAQPEFSLLATLMRDAHDASSPKNCKSGLVHLPFAEDAERAKTPLSTLKMISAARCGRVSYYLRDGKRSTPQEDIAFCERLAGSNPKHLSPFEHIATALSTSEHSGNFTGWKQYREEVE